MILKNTHIFKIVLIFLTYIKNSITNIFREDKIFHLSLTTLKKAEEKGEEISRAAWVLKMPGFPSHLGGAIVHSTLEAFTGFGGGINSPILPRTTELPGLQQEDLECLKDSFHYFFLFSEFYFQEGEWYFPHLFELSI